MVENFKVGGLTKFGLDADILRAANPRLIYASITGFGQDGPYAERAGYDYIIQGMGGLMSITGLPDGEPGGGPMRVGVAVADLFTGLYTSIAILAALYRRERTGEGAHIDMALFDTQLAMLANQASNALVSGKDPPRQGNGHPNIVPYQPFDAADQPIIIAVGNDRQFARAGGDSRRIRNGPSDPAFATNAARVANREPLVPHDRRDHRDQARRGLARASLRKRGFRPGRSTASARRSAIRRRSSRRGADDWRRRAWRGADGRLARSGSTGSAPMRRCRRPRLASIAICCRQCGSTTEELERLRADGIVG